MKATESQRKGKLTRKEKHLLWVKIIQEKNAELKFFRKFVWLLKREVPKERARELQNQARKVGENG